MKVMRLIVPSQLTYALGVLSSVARTSFPDRQVVDVPLQNAEQVEAARKLAEWFEREDGRSQLRNCPSAIDVYLIEVIDLP